MKKLCIIIPSDALLFEGFKDAVELGWKNSVEAAIVLSNYFTPDISAAGAAVLKRREQLKASSNAPKFILRKSYAALKDFDFSTEECNLIADGLGNTLYLEKYAKAVKTKLRLTDTGYQLLKYLQEKIVDGYEVELIRCEHKRERFIGSNGEFVSLMESESQIIENLFPTISITHCGMVPDGGSYIEPLSLVDADEGINIVVLPVGGIDPQIVYETHRKITQPLAKAADDNALRVIAIKDDHEPTRATYFSMPVGGSIAEAHGAIIHPNGLRAAMNKTIPLIKSDKNDHDPDSGNAPLDPSP